MQKKIIMLFILFISNSANAEGMFDNTIFGIAFINQSAELEITNSGQVDSGSVTGSGFGLYLDKYVSKKYRFNTTLSYVSYDAFDVAQLMISADYLVPINGQISLFGGVAAGGALQSYTNSSSSDGALGAVYGGQLGGIMFVNDHLMLELGYRFRPTSGIETEIVDQSNTITSTITDLSETYFSILIMF